MGDQHLVRQVDGSLVIEVVNEPAYAFGSQDNRAPYQREEILGDAKFQLTSRHGVTSTLDGARAASVVFGATGGASGVHQHSLAILEARGFLAVGPFIVCIELPTLATRWVQEVDDATCFGIHICPDRRSLVSHGELEISRLTLGGDVLWRGGGPDIFTGDLSVEAQAVLVEDFNGDTLSFDLETGHSVLQRRPTSR
jgi:hypothetical protein